MEKEEVCPWQIPLSGLEFAVLFSAAFPFAYGFVRIHARTWDMRKGREKKKTRTGGNENKFRVQSIYDRNAIQWYSLEGKREQQYDKTILLLPFICSSFLSGLLSTMNYFTAIPVTMTWLSLSLILLWSPHPVSIFYSSIFFSVWTSIFTRSVFFSLPPRFLK